MFVLEMVGKSDHGKWKLCGGSGTFSFYRVFHGAVSMVSFSVVRPVVGYNAAR